MKSLFSIMAVGFWINVASGVLLTIADASTMLFNPIFLIKTSLVIAAVAVVLVMRVRIFRSPVLDVASLPSGSAFLAATSLILWMAAITAGRLTAYLGANPGIAGL
jgi:hypothetical protein